MCFRDKHKTPLNKKNILYLNSDSPFHIYTFDLAFNYKHTQKIKLASSVAFKMVN